MLRLFGMPFEAAVSATLLFRGFTLWLPLIPADSASNDIVGELGSTYKDIFIFAFAGGRG